MAGSTEATAARGTWPSPAIRYAPPGSRTVRAAETDLTYASTLILFASVAPSRLLHEVLAEDLHLYLNLRLLPLP